MEPDLLNADPDPDPAFQGYPDPDPSFLKRERPAQKNELINFLLFLWVNFVPLDPDPDSQHWIHRFPWRQQHISHRFINFWEKCTKIGHPSVLLKKQAVYINLYAYNYIEE